MGKLTNEEAIKELNEKMQYAKFFNTDHCGGIKIDTIEKAINALQQPEVIRCRECLFGRDHDLFCVCLHHNGLDFVMPDFFCGDAKRRE